MTNDGKLFAAGTYAATLYWFLSEMFTPVLSIYISNLGFNAFQISVIFAAQTFIPFLLTIQIGFLADRLGQHNMLAIGAAFMISGSALLLVSQHFVTFLLVQTLVGLGHIAVWLSSQSIVTFVDAGAREKAIARMSFYTAFGQLAGPLFGGVLFDHAGYRPVLFIYMALSLGLLAVYRIIPKVERVKVTAPASSESKGASLFGAYKTGGELYASNRGIQVATMISFSLAFILFIRVTYLPIYLGELQYSSTQIGLLIALWSFASIVIRPFTAGLIHRFGRLWATGTALVLSLIGLIGFTLLPFHVGLIVSLFVIGIGTGLNQPLAISLVTQSTDHRNRGLGMGLRLMSNRLANWLCPLTLGAASHLAGLTVSFALVSLPLAAVSYYSMKVLAGLPITKVNVTQHDKGVREA